MDVCSSFIYIYSYAIHMSVVCNRMSSVCHPYVLVYHPYTTRMYLYVIRMSLVWTRMLSVCTRMSSICHLYVLVCYPYVTRMGFYYEPLWIANSVNSDTRYCFSIITDLLNPIGCSFEKIHSQKTSLIKKKIWILNNIK